MQVLGKAEGKGKDWHGHVSAVTVEPTWRKIGLAKKLMETLEKISDQKQAYFVDLFVRSSNLKAIEMYEKMGYRIYRRVLEYYSGPDGEDAFDMRKALSKDPDKLSMIPLKNPVHAYEIEWG